MSPTKWVMKVVPPWVGLCVGWFSAIACYYLLDQEPLVFFALPAIGFLLGLRVSKRLDHYE